MRGDIKIEAEFVVVGSGPGGATVARELAKAGKKVVLLERGTDHRGKVHYGTYPGALLYSDRMSLLYTTEGLNIIRPIMLGGATSMYCGCAAPPPAWLEGRYGIDIGAEVEETVKELEIAPLPEDLRGAASTRIAKAALGLGYEWYAQPKFMRPARAGKFECGATCMLGCRCGAKWNAAEWVDEAANLGADIRTGARADRVTIEGGRAVGVEGRIDGAPFSARAEKAVVLCAGGIGTPRILQASGVTRAGVGMTMDITVMVYGFSGRQGTGGEPPMTWSWENDAEGYMLSTLTDPWLMYPLANGKLGVKHLWSWWKWRRLMGIMIKLKDDVSGGVFPDGRISKPLSDAERGRMEAAFDVCRRILVEAGADPKFVFMSPQRGTHPSGTVRIGDMVDGDLAMRDVRGLYACDASVFPEALDRPTVLTIIGLGKRLARTIGA